MGRLTKETPYSEITATLEVLESMGVDSSDLTRIRNDHNHAARIVKSIMEGKQTHGMPYKLARAFLGLNMFGPEEWTLLYGHKFSKKQLQEIEIFPWGKDILTANDPFCLFQNNHDANSIRRRYFAFLGITHIKNEPLNILKWQELHPANKEPHFIHYALDAWYSTELFAIEQTCEFRWYLMPIQTVFLHPEVFLPLGVSLPPGDYWKSYAAQINMVPPEYEVPTKIEEITKIILFHRKHGSYPYYSPSRCRGLDTDRNNYPVGCEEKNGISIPLIIDENNYGISIGIALSRKLLDSFR